MNGIIKMFMCVAMIVITLGCAAQVQVRYGVEATNAMQQGDYDKAIELLTEDIRRSSQNVRFILYGNRGIAYAMKRDFENAIADLNEAIRLTPRNREAFKSQKLVERAFAYRELGNFDNAIADYEAAIAINPQNANAWRGLEETQLLRGSER